MLINGKKLLCVVDTGTQLNIIPRHLIDTVDLTPTDITLNTYGGFKLHVLGKCMLTAEYNGKSTNAEFFVVDTNNEKPLLSTNLCYKLGLLSDLITLIGHTEISELYDGIGTIKNKQYQIPIDTSVSPVKVPPRRTPPALLSKIAAKLHELHDADIIRPITEFEWSSPLVPVIKKNGDLRICVDFRKLNSAIKREPFQIPSLEDIFMQLHGATTFSLLDAASGYHQLEIHPESQHLLTFSSPIGYFCYKRLPFGISSAPEVYQKLMTEVLSGLDGVLCYLDDIVVYGKSRNDHDKKLQLVFDRLKEWGIKLNNTNN